MDYIEITANRFIQQYISGQAVQPVKLIPAAEDEIFKIKSEKDRIRYIGLVLEANNNEYLKHKINCTNGENCAWDKDFITVAYLLGQELAELGINIDDQFTVEEKNDTEAKLDLILSEINTLRFGQEALYDQLKEEIDELRKLIILGKTNWKQLFVGKGIEIIVSGVISESLSKKIIKIMGDGYTNLLNS